MPTLTLKFKENVIKRYRLKKGISVTIGRKEDNKIVIENLAVSGHHAKIDGVGDRFLFTDLKSKNGSFVNDDLVTSHYLADGDVIMVGKHTLTFSLAEGEQAEEQEGGDMDHTMILDTAKHREMLAKTASGLPTGAAESGGPLGVLNYISGGDGEVVLTKKLTKIGKDPESDIVVGGLLVGKSAVTISQRPDGYFLSYVGGMTKPKVNDVAVKSSVKLADLDIVEIGSVKFQFSQPK